MTTKTISGLRLGRFLGVALMVSALVVAGCDTDKLLEVEDSENVTPTTLDNKDLMTIVYTGAMGEFTNMWDNGDAMVAVTAVFSDETFSSGTFPTRTATDRRGQYTPADGNTSDALYVNAHQARYALRDAAARVEVWEGTTHAYFGELKALEGYTYVGLGEVFCSPIPFSDLDENGATLDGVPLSLNEIFNAAVTIFDEAGSGNLAKVGKARALVNLKQYAAAAAAVTGVPTNFSYSVVHSDNAVQNGLYALQGNGRYSVSDVEGGNGLPFRSANDPRVPWYRDPAQMWGFDNAYALYKSKRHYAYSAPIPLATGVEARLIEAEAKLAASDGPGMITILNALRADVGNLMKAMYPGYAEANPTLAPLTDPGTAATRRDLLFRERAFWLFGTGHRMGDLRRLVRDYGVSQAVAYPSGAYHKGGVHGTDLVFPLDFDEANNPLYDPSTCNVGSAG